MDNIQYNDEFDKVLKELYEEHPLTAGKILKSKKNSQLMEYVLKHTQFLENVKLSTRIFYVINHQQEAVRCITCGKALSKSNVRNRNTADFRYALPRFCSPRCECLNEETKKKLNETNLKKYGCEWTLQSNNVKKKIKKTINERYGADYALQNKQIRRKACNTMKERYGNCYSSQCKDLKQKSIETRRRTMYKQFLENKHVVPNFTEDEYAKYGNDLKYSWHCNSCGSDFLAFRNEIWFKEGAIKAYARCEKCYPYNNQGTSCQEHDLAEFINELNVNSIHNSQQNRQIIPPYELDIYIPSKKLAIEYDGLYWHSFENNDNKNYHLNKTEMCKDQGIQLIHVFENEWLDKKEIVKSRLKNLLGIFDKTVFARKCDVKEVDSKTSNEFQEENHIQGAVNAKVNLGLYFTDELISLMTFSKPRFDKKHEWELVRFCNKLGYHVPGAAGKLLKHFERNYHPKTLVSYADRRWSRGNLYEALGFKLDHISSPNYWYFKQNSIILESRVKYQKHKLAKMLEKFDSSLTEQQNMRNNGYKMIFDCGNLVYVKNY